jgi:hypothetical protein
VSDTVAVALIAVGGTLASGGISYLASVRNTNAQLSGVEGEMERLRISHEEESRKERQAAYADFLAAVDNIQQFVVGWSVPHTQEKYTALVNEYIHLHTRVLLLGEEDVIERLAPLVATFDQMGANYNEMTDPSASFAVRLDEAYAPVRIEMLENEAKVINAMKDDIERSRAEATAKRKDSK